MRIVVWQSRNGWRWRIQGRNGEPMATSEAYSSERSCLRTVLRVEDETGLPVTIKRRKRA